MQRLTLAVLLILLVLSVSASAVTVNGTFKITEEPQEPFVVLDPKIAVLIVKSGIENLRFSSTNNIIKVDTQTRGRYILHLRPGTHIITIQHDEFEAATHRSHIDPKDHKIIRVDIGTQPITGGGFDPNRPQITLRYTPSSRGEKIIGGVDGSIMKLDFSSGKFSFRPDPGTHSIKLNNDGRIWEKTFTVQSGDQLEETVEFPGNVTEKWDLDEPGGLYIETEPAGATVYFNRAEMGKTPLTLDELQPGTYPLEIVKELYLDTTITLQVTSLDYANMKLQLTPNFGKLIIKSTPERAMVWINGRQRDYTPLTIPQFTAGNYTLRLTKDMYHDYDGNFTIKPGKSFSESFNLNPMFGTVKIQSTPPGAEVTVDGVLWGTTPVTREQVLSGEYIIKLTLEDYFEEQAKIVVEDAKTLSETYQMRADVGWVTITSSPSGAQVTLVDQNRSLGKTPLNMVSLPQGTHKFKIETDRFEPQEKVVDLALGASETVHVELGKSVGHLKVSTTPQGATVFVDGKKRGQSPTVIKDLPVGTYPVKLEKNGYDILVAQVTITRNEVTTFSPLLGTAGTEKWKKRRSKARMLSFLPGAGQYSSGQPVRGTVYVGGIVGTLAMAYIGMQDHADAKDRYDEADYLYHGVHSDNDYDRYLADMVSAHDDMTTAQDQVNLFLMMAGGIYAVQLIDAWIFGGGEKPVSGNVGNKVSLNPFVAPDNGRVTAGVQVRLPVRW